MAFPVYALFLPLKPYSYVFYYDLILFFFSFERDRDWFYYGTLLDDNEFSIFLVFMDMDYHMYKLLKGQLLVKIKNRANKALVVDLWPLD